LDATRAYLDFLRLRRSPQTTIDARRRLYRRVESHTGTTMIAATAEQLANWYTDLSSRVKPSSQAGELSGVRAFYKWTQVAGLRPDDPSATLPRPQVPVGRPRPIDTEDLFVALKSAPDRVYPAMILAAYAGMRAAEIARAERSHLLDGHVMIVGKGQKTRIIPAHRLVAREYSRAQPYVVPRRDGQAGPINPWMVSRLVNDHLHGLGIDDTLHSLRHWFGTNVYRQSLDIRMTQEFLGHSSPTTTAGYAAWTHDGPVIEDLPTVVAS
jgi:integrase/recombinase XerC